MKKASKRYLIFFFLIIFIATVFRFYNYEQRWGLAYDQAHDALVARHALEANKIPLVGPFSSAGPFQTGGIWYWLIMIGTAIAPSSVITPWVFMTILSIFYIGLLMYVGRKLVDGNFSLILGSIASFSTAQIGQAVNLTNQGPLALASLLAIWAMINYVRDKNKKNLFFLGTAVALAPTIHLQGISLGLLLPVTFLIAGLPPITYLPYLFLGLFIPLIPLIIFDLKNNLVNSGHMITYYLYDQYKISLDVLGRRWLTYIGVFWPKSLSLIIGGNIILGYFIATIATIIIILEYFKKKLTKEWLIITFTFLVIFIVIRYIRTPIFDSYLVLLHTFIFLLTSYVIYFVIKKNLYVGALLCLIVLFGTTQRTIAEVMYSKKNFTAEESITIKEHLVDLFPDQKFALYDLEYKTADKSLPLSLYLDTDKKLFDSGKRIGVADVSRRDYPMKKIFTMQSGTIIFDLSSSSSADLLRNGWVFVNSSAIYKATEDWNSK